MKIKDVFFYPIKIRSNAKGGVYWFLLKLITDSGVEGWGEIIWNAYDPATLEKMVMDMAENYIIGANPFDMEKVFGKIFAIHSKLHTDLSSMGLISGFEIALWDIIGKETGQPVYNLMGGRVNDRIRTYTYLYEKEDRIFCEDFWQLPDACAKRAKEYADMGFTAVKLDRWPPIWIPMLFTCHHGKRCCGQKERLQISGKQWEKMSILSLELMDSLLQQGQSAWQKCWKNTILSGLRNRHHLKTRRY